MKNKRIYLSPPDMSGNELEYVKKVFDSNWIAPVGPDIDAFENKMCEYTGASYAVALSSGTAAIHLALILAGVGRGDEVLCSTFTFAGSAFPIMYMDAIPVFVDSDEKTWNMDPDILELAIKDRIKKGKKPKACIIVHLYGNSANLDAIVDICNKYEIFLIEDSAESLGTKYKEKFTGTIASLGVFSFNGNKIITTSGGGMLVGHDKNMIEKARFLSTQARDNYSYYHHTEIGYNYRMSNVVAAIGRGQMDVIENKVNKKIEIFKRYKKIFEDIEDVELMPENSFERANRWLTCINLKKKSPNELINAFECENIESRRLWKPMHRQPVFSDIPYYGNDVSDKLFRNGLCLPSGTSMSEKDWMRIEKVLVTTLK